MLYYILYCTILHDATMTVTITPAPKWQGKPDYNYKCKREYESKYSYNSVYTYSYQYGSFRADPYKNYMTVTTLSITTATCGSTYLRFRRFYPLIKWQKPLSCR